LREPEGVWTATSADIPGLFIEGASSDEARAEATAWARELLIDNAGLSSDAKVRLVFVTESGQLNGDT
jgi:hypothetical protein